MEIISHLRSTPVTPERCIRYKYVSISHLGLICSHYLLQYILSALCIILFLNGSSQNGLRRRIAFPERTAATRWRYNRKNPAAKRIRQEVKEMQANPSDDFMSLPLEVTSPNGALGSVDYPKDE
ncbi:hypothetical protein Bca4012_042429 [Brassica carinata]